MSKNYQNIYIIGFTTLLAFGLAGILIIEFYLERSFIEDLNRGWPVYWQILLGIMYGILSSFLCMFIINRDFFKAEKEYYKRKVAVFNLNYFNIILVSLCAGIGEEIFFRAALQPIIGIWPTAIIFVILHGYINPRNWRISIYGFFMIIIMLGIGYLYETVGLISVMVAHTVIDIILFNMLMNKRKEFSNEYTDPLRD